MSVVLNPTAFVSIICELYIKHISMYNQGRSAYEDLYCYHSVDEYIDNIIRHRIEMENG